MYIVFISVSERRDKINFHRSKVAPLPGDRPALLEYCQGQELTTVLGQGRQ